MQIKVFTFPGPAASSVTQDGITYTFKNPVQTRQTADGAWAVEMGTEVTYVDPPATGTGEDLRNGLMLNPVVDWNAGVSGQAWDGRDGANMALEQTGNLPIVLNANDILVKGISASDAELEYVSGSPITNDADRKGWCKNSSALYAVADINSLPSGSIMSPAPIGWTDRGDLEFWTVDAAGAVAALAEYDTSILSSSVSFAASESFMSKFQAMATYSFRSTAGGYQAWYMTDSEPGFNSNFGRNLYEAQEPVALSILGNEWTDGEKQTRMIQLASTGVHFLQVAAGSSNYVASWPDGLGAHYQYTRIPVLMARIACAGEPTADNPPVYPLDNVYEEPFVFDEALISDLTTPHTSAGKPREAFERPVDAVDTINDTITVNYGLAGDPLRPYITRSLKAIAVDGSHESLVLSGGNLNETAAAAVIGVYDAGAFAGKDVRFEAVAPFKANDVWWRQNRLESDIQSEANVFYVVQNDYSGWVMCYLAAGFAESDALPAIRWTEMRDQGFRGYDSGPFQTQFAREFWEEHKDAVFAASSVSPGTFSAIPFPIFDDEWSWGIPENTGEVIVTLETLDESNGPTTDVEYSTDGSTWNSFPSFSGLDSYTLSLGGANARPNLQLRAVNAEGEAEVTPGVKVETGPANVAASFPVPESVTSYEGDIGETKNIPIPSGIVSGDLLVLELQLQAGAILSSIDGWINKGANIFTRVADGTEGSFVTPSYGNRLVAICRRFSNAVTVVVGDEAGGIDAPAISLKQYDKFLFVSVMRARRSDWSVSAAPSGYGNLLVEKNESSSADSRIGIASSYRTSETNVEDAGPYTISGTVDSPRTKTYAVLPNAIKPTVLARDSLSSRTLTIQVVRSTGDPAPSFTLTALTNGGADVLGDQTGTDPWTYVVPDSSTTDDVAWTVEASNSGGTWTSSGSTSVPANLFAPSALTAPSIVAGAVHPDKTITFEKGTYDGSTPITVTVTLTLDGTDVTGDMVGLDYTIPSGTVGQSLVYSETADNGVSPTDTQSFSQTVTAAPQNIVFTGQEVESGSGWPDGYTESLVNLNLQEDDFVIAVHSLTDITSTGNNVNLTAPTGTDYTKTLTQRISSDSDAWVLERTGFKQVGVTPDTDIQFSQGDNANRPYASIARGFRNVASISSFNNNGETLTAAPPSVTPTLANSVAVVIITATNNDSLEAFDDNTAADAYGSNNERLSASGGVIWSLGLVMAEFDLTAGVEFTPPTLALNSSATDYAWSATTLLLEPEPA